MDNKQDLSPQSVGDRAVTNQREAAAARIKAATDSVFEQLVVEPSKNVSKLPEPIFKEHFYPYFSGQKPFDPQSQVMAEWVAIAGSPGAPVDIVDPADPEGNVIFTVPPIFDTSIVDAVKRNIGESYADMYSQYQLHSQNIPVVGEKYLADAFSKKLATATKESENLAQNRQRWETIFKRYGTPIPGAVAQETTQTPRGDDVEYD